MIALFIVSIISSSFSKEVTGCIYDKDLIIGREDLIAY